MPVRAVLPAKGFLWGLYDCRTNPAHQIAAFETMATEIGLHEPIYTDINDVAVMGLLHRPAVAGEGSWHPCLPARSACVRDTRGCVVRDLVRWHNDGDESRTRLQNGSASTDNPASSVPGWTPSTQSLPSQRG